MTNEPTDAEVEELRRAVEPVLDAVDAYKSGGGASVTFRDEINCLYADVTTAAMLAVAQARVELLRGLPCLTDWEDDECRSATSWTTEWCVRCTTLAAAEALVCAAHKGEQR